MIVTSPQMSLDQYLAGCANGPLSEDDAVAIMVCDLQRILRNRKVAC